MNEPQTEVNGKGFSAGEVQQRANALGREKELGEVLGKGKLRSDLGI